MKKMSLPRERTICLEEVLLSPDCSTVQIMVTGSGGRRLAESTLTKLNQKKGYIQFELARQLQLYKTPKIVFRSSDRFSNVRRTLELIDAISQD